MNPGGDRDEVMRVDITHDDTGPAIAAPLDLDIKVGDRIRYRGTYTMREGEVIEIPDERLLMVRRERPRGSTWNSLDGGIHSILRSKVVKILEYRIE